MRNLPGLNPILDRATARAEQGPRYRFHGRRSPKDHKRTPVRGQVPSSSVKDGVAKLRLYEPIDSWGGYWGVSALEFAEVLDDLGDDVTEIRLHINSPGGEVWEALAILSNLRDHPAKVVAVVDGIAASCASFIACAADETIMGKNSQLMIHDAWGLCIGNAGDMHSTGDLLDQISNNIASVYADKSGDSTEDWRAIMLTEGWYTGQEAVDAGLADSIAGEQADDTDDTDEGAEAGETDPTDRFDLKGMGMKYAGRAEAPPPPVPGDTIPGEQADDGGAPAPDRLNARRAQRHAARARRHPAA